MPRNRRLPSAEEATNRRIRSGCEKVLSINEIIQAGPIGGYLAGGSVDSIERTICISSRLGAIAYKGDKD